MENTRVKKALARLLVEIGQAEQQVEVLRQILCEQDHFETYSTFLRLDRTRKGFIGSKDFLSFFEENHHEAHSEQDIKDFLIHPYDQDADGDISYAEFLKLVLPLDNPELRTITSQRPIYEIPQTQKLSYDIEYALLRLFDRLIKSNRKLDVLKLQLSSYSDAELLFSLLDKNQKGYIELKALNFFFQQLNLNIIDFEVLWILRSMDLDITGRVSMGEFKAMVTPVTPRNQREGSVDQQKRARPSKKPTDVSYSTQDEFHSSSRNKLASLVTPQNAKEQKHKPKQLSKTQELAENHEPFFAFLKIIIKYERELEILREQLCLRKDFNIFDSFRYFDRDGLGYVTVAQMQEYLAKLNLSTDFSALSLYFIRLNKNKTGQLRFSDYASSIVPKSKKIQSELKGHQSRFKEGALSLEEMWSKTTYKLFFEVFFLTVERESMVESVRQLMMQDDTFDPFKTFKAIASKDSGKFTSKQVKYFLSIAL
eukprot:TRINITY_DN7707_c0_g1_i4.p1 TRINITY_DN7707_c0_g1~~TRINITY_DN7707_c0_g1_i4.p1  ORF type:complete len:482 (+),score=89.83 TRINITY_DN7707_c0_g1_i4:55-1500(+)